MRLRNKPNPAFLGGVAAVSLHANKPAGHGWEPMQMQSHQGSQSGEAQ